MKQELGKQSYVHPSVKVEKIAPVRVLCLSGLQDYEKGEGIDFGLES